MPYREECGKCGATRIDRQIGLEPTLAAYIASLVDVFRDVRRVLRSDGTCWLNIGDSYAGGGGFAPDAPSNQRRAAEGSGTDGVFKFSPRTSERQPNGKPNGSRVPVGLKPKDLMMVPARVAIALQDDGWYVRSDVIWHKRAPMPESATDRPTSAHEHIFLLTKSARYFYDAAAVSEQSNEPDRVRFDQIGGANGHKVRHSPVGMMAGVTTRNLRNVWTLSPEPYPDAHFATFPTEIPRRCIKAGTSEKGACAACGAPWTRQTAKTTTFESGSGKAGNMPNGKHGDSVNGGNINLRMGPTIATDTVGWAASCACDAGTVRHEPDDFEIVESPTGKRAGDDPTMTTGRKGMNRPRGGDDEGTRPITRFEQRQYAEQLRRSPHRAAMEQEAGTAFDHYIRTDRSGARPVPDGLLNAWIERGWLAGAVVPARTPYPVVPCVVLDPFGGSGTTGLVADQLERECILIELNPIYAELARNRIHGASPMFAAVSVL